MMALISGALAIPAVAYLFSSGKTRGGEQWVDAGDVSKLQPDSPIKLVFRRQRVDGWRKVSEDGSAWVVKKADKQIVAFGPNCTHLGCAYHWDPDKKDFLCPCHNSVFTVDGKVQAGPAPRPLDRFDTKLQGNRLLLGSLKTSEDQKA
jgi:menaquinol-cytochrome c reductase iron-sulfur subunit